MTIIDKYKKLVEHNGYNLTIKDCEKIMQYRRSIGQGYNAGNKVVEGLI